MTQEEKWRKNYAEVVEYMDTYHRNPSKHRVEDHLLLNWMKHQRKLMNRGELKPDRVELFKRLLAKSVWISDRGTSDRGTGSVSPRCKYPKYVESDRGLNQSVSEAA